MKLVAQRTNKDCGVAVVAMLTNVSYKRALEAFQFPRGRPRGTTTKHVIAALAQLGFECSHHRLQPWPPRYREGKCLLKTKELFHLKRSGWHWCAWDGRKMFDPAGEEPLKVFSYLEVRRGRVR